MAAEKAKLEKLEELKRQQIDLQKQKLREQADKKKKELEEKKAMEEAEKTKQADLAKMRREETRKLKQEQMDKKKGEELENEKERGGKKEASSSLNDEMRKQREEVLKQRKEESEKAKREEEATKAKIEEMQKKRRESALKKEEEDKRRKEEEMEMRKQMLEEKKLSEQRAREEADEALRKAREEQEKIDTSVKKFKLEEEKPPTMRKEETKRKSEDQAEKKEGKGSEDKVISVGDKQKESEEAKEEATSTVPRGHLMKKRMEEEQERAQKQAEAKKQKEGEEAKRKAEEMKRRREETLAKRKAEEEAKRENKRSDQSEKEEAMRRKEGGEEEEKGRRGREELLKHSKEQEKALAEAEERKKMVEELSKKREDAKRKKEEEEKKQRDDLFEAEKRKMEEQKAKELSARKEAEEALKKAMEEKKGTDKRPAKYAEEREKECAKKETEEQKTTDDAARERAERKLALEEMKKEREALKEKKALASADGEKKREIEEIRKRDMEEAERKRKETERKKRETEGPNGVRTTEEEPMDEKQRVRVDEEAVEKQRRERESRMKKRKLEEEKAKAEQEETKRKMEEMKARALEKKQEEEKRLRERENALAGKEDEKPTREEDQMGEEMGEQKKMRRKATKERVTFKTDEFTEERAESSVEQPASALDKAETLKADIRWRGERRDEDEGWETDEPRLGSMNKHDMKEVDDFEQDEVQQFLESRRRRLQLDELQHFDEELPRATRHRTVRKGFVSLPEAEVIASRGDIVTFECELFNESDQVSWKINGQPLERLRDNRCSIVNYAYIRQLKIVDVVPSDSNMKVQITLDDQTMESVLTVEETPVEFAEKLPRKTIAHCDEKISLAATLSHDAAQKISWYHNGRELTGADTEHTFAKEGCLCSLEIGKVTYRMGGRYTLRVDRVESSTVLEVHGKPSLDQQRGGRIVLDSNENLSLNIRLKSLPEPEVDLYLNGELLTPELRTSITVLEDALLLTRKELTKEDRGTYRVVLFNEYGEDAVEYEVYVRDVPDAPSGLMVTDVGHDYCFLKWNPPPGADLFDDSERITGYVVEKKGAQRRVWQRVGQLSQFTNEIFVEELDYDHAYVFRVAAVNRFGVGEFSKLASITTGMPFSAPVVHSAPRVSHVYERSVRLEWDECWDTGGSPLFGYDVFCKKEGGDWLKLNESTVFVEYCWLDDFLDANKRGCLFKVEAQNYAGLHSDSNVCSEPLQHEEHVDVHMAAPEVEILSGNSVGVLWKSSETAQQKLPQGTRAVIQYRSEGSSVWNEVLEQYRESPAVIEDELKEGVPYRIRVLMKSADGEEIGKSAESRTVKLSGSNLPILTKTLRDALVPKNNEIRLEVCAVGEPSPTYLWFKNGEEIVPTPENDNISISNEGFVSKLTIHRMADGDEGVYTCQVSNSHGTIESRAELLLGAIQAHFTKAFAEHIDLVEGKDVMLECEVSHPDANVRWFRNKRPINEATNRVALDTFGKKRCLTLYGAMKEDSGTYSCETEGSQDRVQTELIVRPPDARILFSPQGRTVREYGERVCLFAELSRTTDRASWFRNGVELMSKKCFAYVDELRANLEIYNFDENDVGEYHVTLGSGERSAPAKLKFEVAPKIQLRRYTDEKLVKIGGEEFSVCATLLGHPQPKLALTLNDKEVPDATVEAVNGEVRISIRKLKRTHSGRIWLHASNEFGQDSTCFDLCVLDVPVPPTKVRAELISSSCVDLYWELGDDGELEEENSVESFIVERKTAERIRWRQIQRKTADRIRTDRGGFFTRIVGLYPNECYAFRILAVNEIGESVPSESVEVVMPDEEEEEAAETSLVSSLSEPIPPLSRPNKPEIIVDPTQTKCSLSWPKVDRAMVYGIHRRKVTAAASDADFWLEISNSERNKFVDRSVLETGRYVYKIIAKLPGVLTSEPSDQSDEVFVLANLRRQSADEENGGQRAEASDKRAAGGLPMRGDATAAKRAVPSVERSDSESSLALSGSQRDSGIQDDDDYRTLMESPAGAKATAPKAKTVKKLVRKKVQFEPTEEATQRMESVEKGREAATNEEPIGGGSPNLTNGVKNEEEDAKDGREPDKKEEKRKREEEEMKQKGEEEIRKEEEKREEEKAKEREEKRRKEQEEKMRKAAEEEKKVAEMERKRIEEEKLKREEERQRKEEEEKRQRMEEEKKKRMEEKRAEEEKKRCEEEKKKEEEKKRKTAEDNKEKKAAEEKKAKIGQEEQKKTVEKRVDGFDNVLEDKEATEGQIRVELGATLDKNAKEALMRAKWYKDGKLLNTRTSLKYKALLEMPRGEAKLIVNRVEKGDAGRYKLELELTKTTVKPTTEANLIVIGKNEKRKSIEVKGGSESVEENPETSKTEEKRKAPEFVKKPKQSIEAISGSRVCLAGAYAGDPMPTFNWLKNGKAFVPTTGDDLTLFNNKFNDDLGLTEFMLEILRFCPSEHSGTYTAVVQNDEGSESVSTVVSELPLEMLGKKRRGDDAARTKRRAKRDEGEQREQQQLPGTSSADEVAALKKAVKAAEGGKPTAEDERKSPSPTPSIDEENQNIHTKIQLRRRRMNGGNGRTLKGQSSAEEREKQRRQNYARQKQRSSISSSLTEDYIVEKESIAGGAEEEEQRTEDGGDKATTAAEEETRLKHKSTLQAVKAAIQQRNTRLCRPRFFIRPKPKKQIEEGKSLRLKTAISANPTSEVTWDKNGIVLETGNKYSLFHEGDFFYLEVHSLTPYDSGLYNCTARNSEGIAICTAQVEVVPSTKAPNGEETETTGRKRSRREQTAPKILEVLPARTKCIVGESLTVECSLSGSPTPAIVWSQNGVPLVSHPERCVLSFDGECATLSFFKISSTDAGTYSCSVENSAGSAKTEMILEVQKPKIRDDDGLAPKFLESKKRLRKEIGESEGNRRETAMVAEVIEGTEPIKFQWFSPNRIEMGGESTAYKIERFEKDSRLTIFDAFPTDSGEYKCVAENKYGSAKCSIELRITERRKSTSEGEVPPAVRSLESNVQSQRGRRCAELRFEVTGSDPVVCWYRIVDGGNEERIIPNVGNKKYETSVTENGKFLSLRIFDVQKADEGQFKLVAINRCGEASAIAKLSVI